MAQDISGRRILVTGASSGIGAATADLLAQRGATVVGAARRTDRIDKVSGVHALFLDLADPPSVARTVAQAAEVMGGIDVLVNSAGLARFGALTTANYNDWRDMFDVNVLGLLSVTQATIPHLRAGNHGQVINVSSMSGHRIVGPGAAVYGATKFAVQAISEGLRKELAPDRVRVSTVSPSYVKDTEIHEGHPEVAVRRQAQSSSDSMGIDVADCADIIAYIVGTTADVQIQQVRVTSDNPP
jgi:NADP-dependent 3-hydroxy acid dehydrogenase YdfG